MTRMIAIYFALIVQKIGGQGPYLAIITVYYRGPYLAIIIV
jgi:hypothetical protein